MGELKKWLVLRCRASRCSPFIGSSIVVRPSHFGRTGKHFLSSMTLPVACVESYHGSERGNWVGFPCKATVILGTVLPISATPSQNVNTSGKGLDPLHLIENLLQVLTLAALDSIWSHVPQSVIFVSIFNISIGWLNHGTNNSTHWSLSASIHDSS